jgi:hypothetical protein
MAKRYLIIAAAIFALAAGSALAADQPKGPFAGTVHAVGTITYKDASQQTWTWDRGRITTLSASSITLTRRDKVQVSFAITASTLVRNDGGTYKLDDLKVGQAATVVSQSGNAAIIRNIRGDGAPSGADQSAIDGPAKGSVTGTVDALYKDGSTQSFDYNRGRITDLSSGSLTITRQDKKTVTLSFDSSLIVRDKGQTEDGSALKLGEGAMFFSQSGKLVLVRCLAEPKATPPPASAPAPAAAAAPAK